MKCLVTGATGFVGRYLTKLLVQKGYQVRVFCRDTSKAPPQTEAYSGDICQVDTLMKATSGIDIVYHLAGFIGYCQHHHKIMQQVNVQGTQNVIEACTHHRIQRLVHISSTSAIGASITPVTLNEDSPFTIAHLNMGYFQTKKQAEELVTKQVKKGKIDAVILNPSAIYGAGDMIKGSRKIQQLVAKGYCPFYPPGGVNVVDVESVVKAIHTATTKGRKGERYILSGENMFIKDLFCIIAEESGCTPPWIPLSKKLLKALGMLGNQLEKINENFPITSSNILISVLYHWFDSSKAKSELNFKPQAARTAIQKSIKWAKNNPELANSKNINLGKE